MYLACRCNEFAADAATLTAPSCAMRNARESPPDTALCSAPSSNSQNHPPGIAASHHVERGIDFIERVFMRDDAVER